MLFGQSGWTLDFKITSVVPVGPIYQGGMTEPALWSPDGTKLAYFHEGQLMIADTLGNTGPVAEIDLPPHRFVWSTDSSILLYQWDYLPRDTIDQNMRTIDRLITININTGISTLLEEFVHRIGDQSEKLAGVFKGPYLTLEGNAFYFVWENYDHGKQEHGPGTIEMAPELSGERASLQQNHILRTALPRGRSHVGESDALYLVRADYLDSIKISNKFYEGYLGRPVTLSSDTTHIMFGGTIVRLADDKTSSLDNFVQRLTRPEGTRVCGFVDESFNPVFPEVVFSLTCDDGHDYIVNRIGVFDYITGTLTILDSMINMTNCSRPIYAKDGRRIFFMSEGVFYYLNREVLYDEERR
jgi:hypothetical protein